MILHDPASQPLPVASPAPLLRGNSGSDLSRLRPRLVICKMGTIPVLPSRVVVRIHRPRLRKESDGLKLAASESWRYPDSRLRHSWVVRPRDPRQGPWRGEAGSRVGWLRAGQ